MVCEGPGDCRSPGIVVGRFMAIKSERINVGIDVAVGDDDWGIYFRIGEVWGDK